jgi:hypothetical protein
VVNPAEYQVAIFQFMPMFRANGMVRDEVSGRGLARARLSFIARSGVLSNAVYDGMPGGAVYRALWVTGPGGVFPTDVWLPAVDWDVCVSRLGYADLVVTGAFLSVPRGMETNYGGFGMAPLFTSNNVPEWWLVDYGLTNDEFAAEALGDTDGDGRPAWAEWVSDTDPTNAASVLRIQGFRRESNGVRIGWEGGTSAWQYIERSDSIEDGAAWTVVFTNEPPTPAATNIFVPGSANGLFFYRIKAAR